MLEQAGSDLASSHLNPAVRRSPGDEGGTHAAVGGYLLNQRRTVMPEGKRNISSDRKRVAGGQEHEVKYAAKKIGTSKAEVKKAVKEAGNSRAKVEKKLREY
jgi:hypothetical protein